MDACRHASPCDWLVPGSSCCPVTSSTLTSAPAKFGADAITLSNGLVSRTFSTKPFALLELRNYVSGEQFSRGAGSEGVLLLNGKNYSLGGFAPPMALYLNLSMVRNGEVREPPQAFTYLRHRRQMVRERFVWKPGRRNSDPRTPWPPRGVGLRIDLCAPASSDDLPEGLMVSLNYEIYDGLAALSKRISLTPVSRACLVERARRVTALARTKNRLATPREHAVSRPVRGCVTLGHMSIEALRLSPRTLGVPYEDENWTYLQGRRLSVFSDLTRPGIDFTVDSDDAYASSPRDRLSVLHAAIPRPKYHGATFAFERRVCAAAEEEDAGADANTDADGLCEEVEDKEAEVEPPPPLPPPPPPAPTSLPPSAAAFASPEILLVLHDSDESERVGMGIRRVHRTLTPQLTENLLYMHCTEPADLKTCLTQSDEAGFELVLLSFGTHQDLESEDERYRDAMSQAAARASTLGLEFGAYILLAATRARGPKAECVAPGGGHTGDTCLASAAGQAAMRKLLAFVDATGLTAVEIDGPYEGAVCNTSHHRHHQGLGDSQLMQWEAQMLLLRRLAARGCYLLVPDPFYLHGTHKIGMGYDEQQYSLPREQWLTLARQQMFDNTYGACMGARAHGLLAASVLEVSLPVMLPQSLTSLLVSPCTILCRQAALARVDDDPARGVPRRRQSRDDRAVQAQSTRVGDDARNAPWVRRHARIPRQAALGRSELAPAAAPVDAIFQAPQGRAHRRRCTHCEAGGRGDGCHPPRGARGGGARPAAASQHWLGAAAHPARRTLSASVLFRATCRRLRHRV